MRLYTILLAALLLAPVVGRADDLICPAVQYVDEQCRYLNWVNLPNLCAERNQLSCSVRAGRLEDRAARLQRRLDVVLAARAACVRQAATPRKKRLCVRRFAAKIKLLRRAMSAQR